MTATILFDLESTGLLRRGSRIHCMVARDMDDLTKPLIYDHREDQTLIWVLRVYVALMC